jgi:hypothetical protein
MEVCLVEVLCHAGDDSHPSTRYDCRAGRRAGGHAFGAAAGAQAELHAQVMATLLEEVHGWRDG